MRYRAGAIYEGAWKDNQYQGKGKLTYADGAIYEGDFTTGCPMVTARKSAQTELPTPGHSSWASGMARVMFGAATACATSANSRRAFTRDAEA